jgi:hypothetical protein
MFYCFIFQRRGIKAIVIVVCICLSVIAAVVVTMVTKKNIGAYFESVFIR